MKHPIYIIVAVDENNGIGKEGKLPWRLKKEIKYFAETTIKTMDPNKQNMVIMGRNTWESLGQQYQPLKGRKNVVLTSSTHFQALGASVANSLDEAIKLADDKIEKIFILGGAKVFSEAVKRTDINAIYLTKIHRVYECDVHFPELSTKFFQVENIGSEKEDNVQYDYLLFKKS